MGLYRHLGLWVSHLPRALLEGGNETLILPPNGTASTTSPSPFPSPYSPKSSAAPFRPSIAVIVGILTAMFSVTFLLLLYAKHCKGAAGGGSYGGGGGNRAGGTGIPTTSSTARRNSGIDRAVVESLPLFRFASLRGHKNGLECAVCLSRFEPAELLRLLPKCKHAFHVECVDTWLDAHSSCPLCRYRVDPEDVLLVQEHESVVASKPDPEVEEPGVGDGGEKRREAKGDHDTHHTSTPGFGFLRVGRVSGRHSSAGEKSSNSPLQIVVHRTEPEEARLRKSVDYGVLRNSVPVKALVGCFDRGRKDGLLPLAESVDKESFERRFGHRIIVSSSADDVDADGGRGGAQRRWSDLRPSDLLFLKSEMILAGNEMCSVSRARSSSAAFGGDGGGGRSVINSRCVSEITGMSRFPGRSNGAARRAEEERALRRWLSFAAKRTARWLGSRETNKPSDYDG